MRIVVKSIDNMPGEARDGLPLGCILDEDASAGPTVVAYGEGGTFSAAGLRIVATQMQSYLAYFEEDDDNSGYNEPIRVKATDMQAALMWLREHYHGEFTLYVQPASTYLGEFQS